MKFEIYNGIVSFIDAVSGVRSNKQLNLKNMQLVRFGSYKNPFIILKQSCGNPDCNCNEVNLEFLDFDEKEVCLTNHVHFSFRLNIKNWKENGKTKRSELYQKLLDEFINDITDEMKSEYKRYYEVNKERAKHIAKFDMSLNDIDGGKLVAYSQIFGNSGSMAFGGNGCGFLFNDKSKEYFIDDLYCIDPRCNCETVHLFFIKNDKAVLNSFVARLNFNKGFKIDENTFPEKDARKIFKKWQESDPDALDVLKGRYKEIKDIGKNLIEKHTKNGKLPVNPKNSILSTRKDKIGRNDPCPCGSGKKYKKCCGVH
jgi:hypothetical protein